MKALPNTDIVKSLKDYFVVNGDSVYFAITSKLYCDSISKPRLLRLYAGKDFKECYQMGGWIHDYDDRNEWAILDDGKAFINKCYCYVNPELPVFSNSLSIEKFFLQYVSNKNWLLLKGWFHGALRCERMGALILDDETIYKAVEHILKLHFGNQVLSGPIYDPDFSLELVVVNMITADFCPPKSEKIRAMMRNVVCLGKKSFIKTKRFTEIETKKTNPNILECTIGRFLSYDKSILRAFGVREDEVNPAVEIKEIVEEIKQEDPPPPDKLLEMIKKLSKDYDNLRFVKSGFTNMVTWVSVYKLLSEVDILPELELLHKLKNKGVCSDAWIPRYGTEEICVILISKDKLRDIINDY